MDWGVMAWTGCQWPVLIGKTGLVECTQCGIIPFCYSWHRAGFSTAGFSNESSYSMKGEKFLTSWMLSKYIFWACKINFQISCFDISIRSSEQDYIIPRGVPRAEDFLSVLLETKGGDPHPDTGIPPAFLTVRWSESIGKASKIDVELGRPTKIYYSIAQWCFIDTVLKKVQHCLHVSIFSV